MAVSVFTRRLSQCSTRICTNSRQTLTPQPCQTRKLWTNHTFPRVQSVVRHGKGLCAVAGVLTAGYLSYTWLQQRATVFADDPKRPKFPPSRKIVHDTDKTGLKLTLYQYQTCPFCCKLRAYLDYHGFSYDVIEVNSVSRKQVRWSKYKKVPILVLEGQGEQGYLQLNDSSVIISILATYLLDPSANLSKLLNYYPSIETKNERGKTVFEFPNKYFTMYGEKAAPPLAYLREEREWRAWTDKNLVHMLSPNVYRTPSEALQAFKYFSEVGEWEKNFSTFERLIVVYVGAAAMYILGKRLKKRYHLKDDVRQSLYDSCQEWVKGVGPSRQFMGGDSPNLADLAVYGTLSSIEGCDAFQDVLRQTKIGPWFYRTKEAVNQHWAASQLSVAS